MGQPVEFAREIGAVTIRALSLADWNAYRTFVNRIEPDDMRLRFAGWMKLDAGRCRKLLDVDHDREEALAAIDREGAILGVARLVRTSPGEADIALIVRSDLKRRGLGLLLLERLIRHAGAAGISVLSGDVLHENRAMLKLARRAGFSLVGSGSLMVGIRMDLGGAMPPPAVWPAIGPGRWAART